MPAETVPQPAFPGFASPSFTQVPDELFDQLMPALSDCELRVLLYIIRRTFGFKRDADAISLSQMVSGITTRDGRVLDHGTGLSKATVARGLKGLREKGIIEAERQQSAERGHEPTRYRLRFRDAALLSQPRDKGNSRPLVSYARHAMSQPRDTQETGSRNTDFESSKGNDLEAETGAGERGGPNRTTSQPAQTGSSSEAGSLGAILQHRVRRDVGREDRLAISAAVERLADELGDQADRKATLSRALNLFQASGVSRDAFIDVLFQASGETQDRRQHPGKAPMPRNRMAYFFAVVEDRLGVST